MTTHQSRNPLHHSQVHKDQEVVGGMWFVDACWKMDLEQLPFLELVAGFTVVVYFFHSFLDLRQFKVRAGARLDSIGDADILLDQ